MIYVICLKRESEYNIMLATLLMTGLMPAQQSGREEAKVDYKITSEML